MTVNSKPKTVQNKLTTV